MKSSSILLSKDGTAKLANMEISDVAKDGLLHTQIGTPNYASP